MSKITVSFGRKDALRYQESTLADMIKQAETDLQLMQDNHQQHSRMRQLVNDSVDVWQPMSDILRPISNVNRASENVKYHQLLIDFMRSKMQAASFLIDDQADPKVIVNQFGLSPI